MGLTERDAQALGGSKKSLVFATGQTHPGKGSKALRKGRLKKLMWAGPIIPPRLVLGDSTAVARRSDRPACKLEVV